MEKSFMTIPAAAKHGFGASVGVSILGKSSGCLLGDSEKVFDFATASAENQGTTELGK
jgi:hypothetical protein